VDNIQVFANKVGIIKRMKTFMALVLKGIDSIFDWKFFEDKLVDGSTFSIEKLEKAFYFGFQNM